MAGHGRGARQLVQLSHGLGADDDEARPVAGLVLDAAGQDGKAGHVGQLAVADGRGLRIGGGHAGRGGGGFHGDEARLGQVAAQPAAALGQRLGMRVDRGDLGQAGGVAQQAVRDGREELGLDMHVILEEQVEADAHGALQGIFQRHHAQLAAAGVHVGEDLRQVVAGMEAGGMAQILHTGKIGEGAFRAQIGHVLRALQGARRGEDLAPDGTQVFFGQGAVVLAGQAVQHFAFAQGLEHDAGVPGLDAAHFQAQGGAAVEQRQQFLVHAVDLAADGGQALGGVGGGMCVGHATPRGFLPGCACRSGGLPDPGGRAPYRRA